MSDDRAEMLRELVARWNSGHRGSAILLAERYDPAIELQSPLSSLAGEPYRGYAGMERWLADLDEQFSEWAIALEDVRAVGERLVAVGTVSAVGRASGVCLQFKSASVFQFGSDERITHIRIYADVGEALEAVGLAG
jgi:hypothetical protein